MVRGEGKGGGARRAKEHGGGSGGAFGVKEKR